MTAALLLWVSVLQPEAAQATSADVVSVSAGFFHTCAVTAAGGAECWGSNGWGELGDGTTYQTSVPVDVTGLSSGVTAISAGYGFTCALLTGGAVKCWGRGQTGALGNGTWTDSAVPVDVSGLSSGVIGIEAGFDHACAITGSGGVQCWGDNYVGQLGDGTTTNSATPVDVQGLSSGVVAITSNGDAGGSHTCALTTGGGVECWGTNTKGELGDGSTTNRSTPVAVTGLSSGVSAVTAGDLHTCAIVSGDVQCWGRNYYGELGDGTTTDSPTPVDVQGVTGAVGLDGGGYHTCAIVAGGDVTCWGLNEQGQLGDGSFYSPRPPVSVTGLTTAAVAVSGGDYHTCALLNDGKPTCWGGNHFGQVGDGTKVDRSSPAGLRIAPPILDASIGLRGRTAVSGVGTIETTGVDQTRSVRRKAPDIVRFVIHIENDGSFSDAFTVSVPWVGGAFHLRYLSGSTDVTSGVLAYGGWTTPSVASGASMELELRVKMDEAASGTMTVPIEVASVTSTGVRDVVRARVHVRT